MTRWHGAVAILLAVPALLGADGVADECLLRTYDVREVLAVGTRSLPAPLGVFHRVDPSVARGFGMRRAGAGDSPGDPTGSLPAESGRAMEAELLRLVREAAGAAAWQPAGRGAAALHDGLLCVWQTARAHGRIRTLLERLRARAAMQVVIRVGLYVCAPEAVRRVREALRVGDLKPINPLLPARAPAVKGAMLRPEQIVTAIRLLNTTTGSQPLFGGTVPCLPMREAAVEDLRQVLFVSHLGPAGENGARTAEGGVASVGSVVGLRPVPSADLSRVQLGVSARVAHLAAIDAAPAAGPGDARSPEPVHRPVVRTTALDMTLVVPAGRGVLVTGPVVTVGDEWGRPKAGQLMGVFWPTVARMAAPDQADRAALIAALDQPFGVSLTNTRLSEAVATLERTGVRIEIRAEPAGDAAKAFLERRVTFVRREATLIEVLGALLGDRLERVALLPPDRLRLTVRAEAGPTTRAGATDEPIGTLTVRSRDGRAVTHLNVRRRDLTPAVRASIEEVLSDSLKNQGADDRRQ